MTGPTFPDASGDQGTRYQNGTVPTAAGAAPATAADDGNPGSHHATQLGRGFRTLMSAHPVLTGIVALAGLGLILENWHAFLLLLSFTAVLAGLAILGMLAIDSWRRRRQEKAELATRADDQNEALLHGDHQWGVFGIRPATESGLDSPPKLGRSDRPLIMAGVAAAVALVVFAALGIVHGRSADQGSGPLPTATMAPPVSRPTPFPMNPTAPQPIPSASFPAPRPAPPSPQSPAPVRLGQRAVDGSVTFVVTSVARSKTVGNRSLPFMQTTAKGTFLTAELTITNNGSQLQEFIASYQRLKMNDAVYVPDPAAAVWTLTFEAMVGPGTTATATLSFDVPTDTPPGGMLELHRSSNSPGATVELLSPQ